MARIGAFRKPRKFYVLLGIGSLAAVIVGAQSSVIVNQIRAPTRAVVIGIPPQGGVEASLSRNLQTIRLMKSAKSAPGKLETRLAEEAFAKEPLARPAWSVLVQSLAGAGKQEQSERWLELAGGLSRRDNLLNAMLIDQALQRKEPQRALRLLGRAMSVDHDVQQLYLKRMAIGTADAEAKAVLVPLLGRNPSWSEGYWAAILEEPGSLQNAGEIRLQIAGSPWRVNRPASTDFALIANLASQNRPFLAYKIARGLGMTTGSNGEILTGSTFERQPRFIPFEWELLQTGDIGAVIDPKTRTLSISSLPAASGIVARQTVYIPGAGSYRLRWNLTGLRAAVYANLKLRLACAEPSQIGTPIPPITMAEGEGTGILLVPPTACNWYSVTLELDAPDSAVGADVVIRRLSLRRDNGVTDGRASPTVER